MLAPVLTPVPPGPDPALDQVHKTGPLGALVRRQAAALGGRVYAEDARSNRVLSFCDLDQWRSTFADAALPASATVAVSISDPLLCAGALVGAVASGLWVAPLDPATPDSGPSGLTSLTARVGADLVLADRPAPTGVPCRWIEVESLAPSHGCAGAPGDLYIPATGGVVLSSSGTTGPPKVVRLGQDKLVHAASSVAAHHGLTADDRGFNPLPLFHINAEVVGLLSTLVSGSCLVLDDRFHRSGFWDLMDRRRITWINAVPAIISRLVETRPHEIVPPGVRFIRSASAPLSVATAERFEAKTGIPVVETYGMTEAASQITAHPLSVPRRAGSVGRPVGLELRVVRGGDSSVTPTHCRPDEVGEVEIRGTSVIERYEGAEHADRFRADGWLRTGDLGRRDNEGFLYLVARTDDVINRGGEKVFPREIEEVLSADPAVLSVAVVGRADAELGQVPVAYVVLRGVESPVDAERLLPAILPRLVAGIERNLVRARRPTALHVVSSFPVGPTGKVRRRVLSEPGTPILRTITCG